MPFTLRKAGSADAGILTKLIRELANYEKLGHQAHPDEVQLAGHLGRYARPRCEAVLAVDTDSDDVIGYALYFNNYSTFLTDWGIYLEDLYVRPSHRGRGVGQALVKRLAQIAIDQGCERLEWVVLDWNESAIHFYERIGAKVMRDWMPMRLEGDALRSFAETSPSKTD